MTTRHISDRRRTRPEPETASFRATQVLAQPRAIGGEMSILIKNGLVITHAGSFEADVLIEGERVSALGARGSDWVADEVIDAAGKYVVPGGIDVHTHMELPFGGTFASDSFETGTRAAAWGGTTTIIDFAVQSKGSGLMEGWEAWMAKAEGNCAIDYGFHLILSDVNDQSLKEMDIAIGEGVSSFKMFMAYPGVFYSTDGEIFRAMQKASRERGDRHDARRERHRHRRPHRPGVGKR